MSKQDDEAPMQDHEWRGMRGGVWVAVALSWVVWCGVAVILWRMLVVR